MKTSIASLQERLAGWTDWDIACYHLGACLGFFPEFGAPYGEDPWHGFKSVIWSDNPLGNALVDFLANLVDIDCVERRESDYILDSNGQSIPDQGYTDTAYRWKPNFVIGE